MPPMDTILEQAIKSHKTLSLDTDKRYVFEDFIHSYSMKCAFDIFSCNEKKLAKHLPDILHHISEAVTYTKPRIVFHERTMTLEKMIDKIIQRIEERFEVEDLLINKVKEIQKNNTNSIINFNQLLLRQLRSFVHGFHTCGRFYKFKITSHHNNATTLYYVSTLDSFSNKKSKKIFDDRFNITISKEVRSAYWELNKKTKDFFSFKEGDKTILQKKELEQFLKLLFQGLLQPAIDYNDSNSKFGKSRINAF